MTTLIKQHTREDHADSLADYLPGGKLFLSARIQDSNFRALLLGLASELFTSEGYLKTIADEYDIETTTLFIDEREKDLGIPDSCFPGTGSIQERRLHVLVKLASLGVQTSQDFIDMAALFGVEVQVEPGIHFAIFPFTFPLLFWSSLKQARFTIVVDFELEAANEFPLTFPIPFGEPVLTLLRCLFEKLKPANCNLLFRKI